MELSNSFNKYLLSAYHMLSTVVDTRGAMVSKNMCGPYSHGASSLRGEADTNQ